MIVLRQLKEEDAPFMLEWMHDSEIQKGFQKEMSKMDLSDVVRFCREAKISSCPQDMQTRHFAIVDNEDDEYLGTISLKNIDNKNRTAEYAISTRKKVHGRGIAKKATGLLLKKAFQDYNLNRVYLSVLKNNKAAIALYERSGFVFEGMARNHILKDGTFETLMWYGMLREEFDVSRFEEVRDN